ncbi:MAG: DUF4012 domain-containing protein [Candidatus Pacebacteria bacterium]|nr:DUF4012 domain-containing protein [Candidatus Paceibacterota bacterium]PIR63158.1 MAG: hypothetical protein COU64_05570 [Candidatus Pacebacteria bacterium CG10_big_fil_rev_8_21_14_0_10_40_26]PIZ78188.1 MAG: hypothetical protein COY01_05390 [Candidatus Pacebacteria bacterium CG_4_10_14_0_2_um_filter_40_20]PJA69160.1 MAG: hypothetical protein CO156_02360 [Candidatus Pacebacteria bacterium CG_4_9_14_3_um_filter_40_12]PJC41707.1 MAG: hypothetical protein CO041_03245 [Candidatus Pacebacteria bact
MKKKRGSHSKLILGIVLVLVCTFAWILFSAYSAKQLIAALRAQDSAAVASHSRTLKLSSHTLSILSFHKLPTIETIDGILSIASKAQQATDAIKAVQQSASTESIDLTELLSLAVSVEDDSIQIEKNLPNCKLCARIIPENTQNDVTRVLHTTQLAGNVASSLQHGTHRFLILFQNSDELRATGGFTGSYAVITLIDGVIQPISIADIYDADGQFTGEIPAPSGVKEYLSSDRGLRLPDANWAPNFPTSAKQILQFFALGDQNTFDGVVAITDSYFEDLLTVLGPIWLPDYQLTVTPENLTSVLRSNREDFFAGSIQKKHLLGQFQNQVLIAATDPDVDPTAILALTIQNMQAKNIQAYSSLEPLQEIFSALEIDGKMFTQEATSSLAFVESNVGINKANKHIARAISLQNSGSTLTARYFIENTNEPPGKTQLQNLVDMPEKVRTASDEAQHLAYVNYQRVVYPSSWKISNIDIPGSGTPQLHSNNQSLSPSIEVTETGFLVVVPEKNSTIVTITFDTRTPLTNSTLELYKQPGTEPVPVWIEPLGTTPFSTKPTLILEKNHVTIMP